MARLRWRADLHAGETLLVHGAGRRRRPDGGRVGKAMGATVIATARGADKLGRRPRATAPTTCSTARAPTVEGRDARADRTDAARTSSSTRWAAPCSRLSLRSIAWEGRIVVIGFASGNVPQIPANILLVKNAAVLGFYWGSYRKHDPERLRRQLRATLLRLACGRAASAACLAHACRSTEAAEAVRLLTSRQSTGKVVLTVG